MNGAHPSGGGIVFLGFDYGRKTTGVAIGSPLTGTAAPLCDIRGNFDAQIAAAENIVAEWKPARLVVGVPTHLDGARHATTAAAERFAAALAARVGLPLITADERLTTDSARRRIAARLQTAAGQKKSARRRASSFAAAKKISIHAVAAAEILQAWLDSQK